MDPLSDIIALLRPSAAVSKPISGRGRWAVRYAAHAAPGFTIILKGECWVEFDAEPPLQLREGDFLLLPATPAFTLGSDPGLPGLPHEPVATAVRHGEPTGEADFDALGGSFHIQQANAPLLLALLPRLVHIPAADGRAHRIGRVIELIRDECARDEPGRELLLQRLLDVLLIEALRRRATGGDTATAGLLAGMRDPMLAKALAAMHGDVGAGWTVAGLARLAGQSRSAFAARFAAVLGCGPIEYLARWRMALAKDALMQGGKPLERIAAEIGYESASAFSLAFRKRQGCPPGQFARQAGRARENQVSASF